MHIDPKKDIFTDDGEFLHIAKGKNPKGDVSVNTPWYKPERSWGMFAWNMLATIAHLFGKKLEKWEKITVTKETITYSEKNPKTTQIKTAYIFASKLGAETNLPIPASSRRPGPSTQQRQAATPPIANTRGSINRVANSPSKPALDSEAIDSVSASLDNLIGELQTQAKKPKFDLYNQLSLEYTPEGSTQKKAMGLHAFFLNAFANMPLININECLSHGSFNLDLLMKASQKALAEVEKNPSITAQDKGKAKALLFRTHFLAKQLAAIQPSTKIDEKHFIMSKHDKKTLASYLASKP